MVVGPRYGCAAGSSGSKTFCRYGPTLSAWPLAVARMKPSLCTDTTQGQGEEGVLATCQVAEVRVPCVPVTAAASRRRLQAVAAAAARPATRPENRHPPRKLPSSDR